MSLYIMKTLYEKYYRRLSDIASENAFKKELSQISNLNKITDFYTKTRNQYNVELNLTRKDFLKKELTNYTTQIINLYYDICRVIPHEKTHAENIITNLNVPYLNQLIEDYNKTRVGSPIRMLETPTTSERINRAVQNNNVIHPNQELPPIIKKPVERNIGSIVVH